VKRGEQGEKNQRGKGWLQGGEGTDFARHRGEVLRPGKVVKRCRGKICGRKSFHAHQRCAFIQNRRRSAKVKERRKRENFSGRGAKNGPMESEGGGGEGGDISAGGSQGRCLEFLELVLRKGKSLVEEGRGLQRLAEREGSFSTARRHLSRLLTKRSRAKTGKKSSGSDEE